MSRPAWLALVAVTLVSSPALAQDTLDVPGFLDASYVAPSVTSRPRPVVIALHGNNDRPEWMCAALAPVIRGRAFLVCPRGTPRRDDTDEDPRWTHLPVRRLVLEVAAARAALAAAFPGAVDDGPDVWIGFSLGAHRVASIATRDPDLVRLALLVEGGDALFDDAEAAERFGRTTPRVGVTCALPGCERRGGRLVTRLEASGGAGLVERIETCHWCIDVMRPALEHVFDWLVSTDGRF